MAETLIGIFLEAVATHRKAAQFVRPGPSGWESISAERALHDVESLALGLEALGVGRGDRVAILAENRYEWPISDLALLGLGAITAEIHGVIGFQRPRIGEFGKLVVRDVTFFEDTEIYAKQLFAQD